MTFTEMCINSNNKVIEMLKKEKQTEIIEIVIRNLQAENEKLVNSNSA